MYVYSARKVQDHTASAANFLLSLAAAHGDSKTPVSYTPSVDDPVRTTFNWPKPGDVSPMRG